VIYLSIDLFNVFLLYLILMKIFITYFCFYYFYFKNLVPIFLSILFIWPRPSVRIMGSPGEHNFITSFAAGAAVWPSLQFTASTSLISPPFGPRIQFSDFGFIDRMPRVAVAKIEPRSVQRLKTGPERRRIGPLVIINICSPLCRTNRTAAQQNRRPPSSAQPEIS